MYLPQKHVSSHPRYRGSGVFGTIGKIFGKVAKKLTGETAKKLAMKAVKTAGEKAGKAVLKKTQSIAEEKSSQLIDRFIKAASTKPKSGKKKINNSAKQIPNKLLSGVNPPKLTPDEFIINLMAGSGNTTLKTSRPNLTKIEDIVNRAITTPYLGSGIKTT